ncbi:uncharacterized protein LOC125005132 [Mugil cephalus]|uniref:uncharacterized protein LOC125005132 n=1 Tax=Mugil cephalus TaxID=48193 RepID=UPI001FB6DE02|nr:uncharacterized protein LOC125005132 [Mugil cephalus]
MELPPQEDALLESYRTPDRDHVDALLDISEEILLNEKEPHEFHCYSGLEESVCGWARVAPLSCIFSSQRQCRKPKHTDPGGTTLSPVDPTPSHGDGSVSIAAQLCESHVGLHDFKKSTSLNQQPGAWSEAATAAQKSDATEGPVLNALHRNTAHPFFEEKLNVEGRSRETPLQPRHACTKISVFENKATHPQKPSHRPNNTAIPIQNFTFLPPIKSPRMNPKGGGQLCRGKKASEGENSREYYFMLDKKSGGRGTRLDTVSYLDLPSNPAALTSKYQTCQHNPHLFSAVSVSVPKRYQVATSPKPDSLHRTSYSLGKRLEQTIGQTYMHPSCLFS